jgi:hypothetical protein
MHLCISGPATALADIPEVNELLAGVLACADKVLAQTPIYFPAPALAAAWALHIRVLHRIVIGALLLFGQGDGVTANELMRQGCRDVVRVRRDFGNV